MVFMGSYTLECTNFKGLRPAHTCRWEGQSQTPTSRDALFNQKVSAAATRRKARAHRPFAGEQVSFSKNNLLSWFGTLLSSTS